MVHLVWHPVAQSVQRDPPPPNKVQKQDLETKSEDNNRFCFHVLLPDLMKDLGGNMEVPFSHHGA